MQFTKIIANKFQNMIKFTENRESIKMDAYLNSLPFLHVNLLSEIKYYGIFVSQSEGSQCNRSSSGQLFIKAN